MSQIERNNEKYQRALKSARRLLRDELDAIYDCACRFDADGKPNLSTLDGNFKPLVRRYKRTLSQIDRLV